MPKTYLTFSAQVSAADTETRTIKGLVVPFGKVGNTSAGKVVFELGSISDPDPSAVKFLLQHDPARPIGRAAAFDIVPSGIMGSFKVSSTTAGNDALVEASDGLRDGLSVGASVHAFEMKEGVMHVTSASIDEVSLVHAPAFTDAKVTDVAASENDELETETAQEPTAQEGEKMSEETATTEVEASVPVVTAAAPAYTSVRSPITSDSTYLEHSIKAACGNEDSRQYVRAADDAMTNNTGVNRPSTQSRFIDSQIGITSAIDAIGRTPLIANGMTFETPRFLTDPTVADVAEGGAPSETGITGDFIVNTVKKASGLQRMSFELLDRSSPQFYEAMVQKLQKAAAKAADTAVLTALGTSGTLPTTTYAADAAGLIAYCSTESVAALSGTGEFATALIASPAHWAAIQGYTDTTGRPLFMSTGATSNAAGTATSRSLRGNVRDLDLYVDPFFATTGIVDNSAFIITPDAVKYYESPQRLLQVNQLTSGEVEVNLYHYYCVTVEKPLGVRRFNLT